MTTCSSMTTSSRRLNPPSILVLLALTLGLCGCSVEPEEPADSGDPTAQAETESVDASTAADTDGESSGGEVGSSSSSGSGLMTSSTGGPDEETTGDENEFDPEQTAVLLAGANPQLFVGSVGVKCDETYDYVCGGGIVVRITLPNPVEVGVYALQSGDVQLEVVERWLTDCMGNGGTQPSYPATAGQLEVLEVDDATVVFRLSDVEPAGEYAELVDIEFEAPRCAA